MRQTKQGRTSARERNGWKTYMGKEERLIQLKRKKTFVQTRTNVLSRKRIKISRQEISFKKIKKMSRVCQICMSNYVHDKKIKTPFPSGELETMHGVYIMSALCVLCNFDNHLWWQIHRTCIYIHVKQNSTVKRTPSQAGTVYLAMKWVCVMLPGTVCVKKSVCGCVCVCVE